MRRIGAGSSPLARGTQAYASETPGVRRLIPARAGNTSTSYVEKAPGSAHPRSRGEHRDS